MIRRAFTMRLKPGGLAEYRGHHDKIWPELVDEIERQGIAQITIFETTRSCSCTRRSGTRTPGTGCGTPRSTTSGARS